MLTIEFKSVNEKSFDNNVKSYVQRRKQKFLRKMCFVKKECFV